MAVKDLVSSNEDGVSTMMVVLVVLVFVAIISYFVSWIVNGIPTIAGELVTLIQSAMGGGATVNLANKGASVFNTYQASKYSANNSQSLVNDDPVI